jgi:hypothetical protein
VSASPGGHSGKEVSAPSGPSSVKGRPPLAGKSPTHTPTAATAPVVVGVVVGEGTEGTTTQKEKKTAASEKKPSDEEAVSGKIPYHTKYAAESFG